MDLSSYIQEALWTNSFKGRFLRPFPTALLILSHCPLIPSLMPWLKPLCFIDFSFTLTGTIAIVGFYMRDHWWCSEVCKSTTLLKWEFLGVSVSVYLFSGGGITLFCITEESPPPITNRHDVFRHIQVFYIIQRKKDQTIREERMSFTCNKESLFSSSAGETLLWVKRTQTFSLEPPMGRKSGKPSHTRALRSKAKFSQKVGFLVF